MFDKGQDRKRKFSEKSGDHSNVRDPRFKKVRKDKSGNDGIGGGRPKFKVALNQKSNFGQGQNRKSNFGEGSKLISVTRERTGRRRGRFRFSILTALVRITKENEIIFGHFFVSFEYILISNLRFICGIWEGP